MTTNNQAGQFDSAPGNARRCPSTAHTCTLNEHHEPFVCCLHDLARRERLDVSAADNKVMRTVVSGAASLCAGLPDGRRQILYLATPGDMICPQATIAGTEMWVEALAPSCICEIRVQAATPCRDLLLRASNAFLDATMSHLLNIGRLDGTERVIAFLVDMTRRLGAQEAGRLVVQLPLNREDIADYLGLNAETVSRILSRIKRSGLVIFHSPSEFEVPDLTELRARSPIHQPARANWSPRGHRAA